MGQVLKTGLASFWPYFPSAKRVAYQLSVSSCLFLISFLAVTFAPVAGQSIDSGSLDKQAPEQMDSEQEPSEPYNSGWSLFVDNDILAFMGQDDRYTGGIALALSGRQAAELPISLDPVLGFLNRVTRFSTLSGRHAVPRQSIEFGFTAFTPEDIQTTEPVPDQHPYASLIFLNNTRKTEVTGSPTSYLSTFSIGVLGLDAVGEVQNAIHRVTGSDEANGWDNQISEGGEPTAMYTLVREDVLLEQQTNALDYDLRSMFGGSVGSVIQLGGGVNFRIGRISNASWQPKPDYAEFINLGSPVAKTENQPTSVNDLYFRAGLQVRLRGYNALLEGQFRDSAVTFDRSELRKVIGRGSAGMTWEFQSGTHLSFTGHARTPEIRDTEDSLPIWGSVILTQTY